MLILLKLWILKSKIVLKSALRIYNTDRKTEHPLHLKGKVKSFIKALMINMDCLRNLSF